MNRSTRHTLIAVAISTALTMGSAYANTDPTGQFRGTVTSSAGGSVAGATITLRSETQGFTRTITADENGNYLIRGVPVGTYTITISKPGFRSAQQEKITVSLGGAAQFDAVLNSGSGDVEVLEVVGQRISSIDPESTSSGLVISANELQNLPVAQDITSVALLAPGAIEGDGDFGYLPSFSGASVAENAYYLNGFNITDMRKGMGWLDFPWEAVKESQVITGGVSAQYGRFIGGVTNMVTKSGENEWHFGGSIDYKPRDLAKQAPNVYGRRYVNDTTIVYDMLVNNEASRSDTSELSVYASGPLIRDKAFIYAVLAPSRTDSESGAANLVGSNGLSTGLGSKNQFERDSALVAIDWFITDDHSVNLTWITSGEDNHNDIYAYDYFKGLHNKVSGPSGFSDWSRERWVKSLSYRGQLTNDIYVSATAGRSFNEYEALSSTPTTVPIWDRRTGVWTKITDFATNRNDVNGDEREAVRVDLEWTLDDHTLRIGYDSDTIDSWRDFGYIGPNASHNKAHEYYAAPAQNLLINAGGGRTFTVNAGTPYAILYDRDIHARVSGESEALYIEDSWRISDEWHLNAGIRAETFTNSTGAGDAYVDQENQIAPRLGVIWNIGGDGTQKAFFNFGRYYLPVPQNTGVRMAAPEWNIRTYLPILNSVPGTPATFGNAYGEVVFANGEVRDGEVYATRNLDPMYEDEYILGYQYALDKDWNLGARVIYRDLISSIEDAQVDYAIYAWCEATDTDCSNYHPGSWNGGSARIMNPGKGASITDDFNGDSALETYFIPAQYLGYPEMERTYKALELTAEGRVKDFRLRVNYTYSKSEGNTEGMLRSDNDQSDPGWTRSFDTPELTDYANGYLPNDRRHNLKVFGSYAFADNWSAGFTWRLNSGRPLNRIGFHDLDDGSCATVRPTCDDGYYAENFYFDGKPSPRGSWGRTPWVNSLNTNLNYRTSIAGGDLLLSLNIYNLFNSQHATQLNEYGEDTLYEDGSTRKALNWRSPTSFQTPRYVTLTARYDF